LHQDDFAPAVCMGKELVLSDEFKHELCTVYHHTQCKQSNDDLAFFSLSFSKALHISQFEKKKHQF
jgi:hypothetical protein